jgi:CDGSH-type Zn-finger protein
MQKTFTDEDIEQIMAEAEELLAQIDPEILEYMDEEQRAQLEQQAQDLKKLKSEVEDKIGKEGPSQGKPYSEGMHEAIEDIAKAMKALASYLS